MDAAKSALLMLAVIMVSGVVTAAPLVKQEPEPAGPTYQEVWSWCGDRFPYRDDLQEACRWGAYEMLPGEDVEEA